jgi:hypothetical protein
VEGVVVRSPYCNPILIFTPLVPEIIQHEAAMHFGDEESHVVYKSMAEDFAYGSVGGVEPGLCGRFEDRESPIAHEKLSHRFKTRDGLWDRDMCQPNPQPKSSLARLRWPKIP